MAKVSARGAYEVCTLLAEHTLSWGKGQSTVYRVRVTLRSDGAVLDRITHIDGKAHATGYKVKARFGDEAMAKLKPGLAFDQERCATALRYAAKRFGYSVVEGS